MRTGKESRAAAAVSFISPALTFPLARQAQRPNLGETNLNLTWLSHTGQQ